MKHSAIFYPARRLFTAVFSCTLLLCLSWVPAGSFAGDGATGLLLRPGNASLGKDASNMLPSGYPLATSLPGNAFGSIGVEVPPGSEQLTVTLTKGSGELRVFLKYGSAASGGSATDPGEILVNFVGDADVSSNGSSPDQIIVLNADTTPPLMPGTWYISPYNRNPEETSFTLTATVGKKGVPVPEGTFSFPPYDAVVSPVKTADPSSAFPLGLGTVANGGDTLTVGFDAVEFLGPVDVYLGLYAPAIANALFLFAADNTLVPASSGVVAWRSNATSPVGLPILGGIPASWLPAGVYYFYVLVTPAGGSGGFYFWSTQFGGTTTETVVPDAETVLSSIDGSFSLSFPAGSVAVNTDISVTPLAGGGFKLGPDGLQFQKLVGVSSNLPAPAVLDETTGRLSLPLPLGLIESSDGTVESLDQAFVSYSGGDANASIAGYLTHFSNVLVLEHLGISIEFDPGAVSMLVPKTALASLTAHSKIPYLATFQGVSDRFVVKSASVTDVSIKASGALEGSGTSSLPFLFTRPTGSGGTVLLETPVTCRHDGKGTVTAEFMFAREIDQLRPDGSLRRTSLYSSPVSISAYIACHGVGSCPDGIINQESEQCDTKDLGGKTCNDLGFDGGELKCDDLCYFDTLLCFKEQVVPACGDGVINRPEEQCDGDDFGGKSCKSFGFESGVLSCSSGCMIETAGCYNGEVGMIGSLYGSFAHFSGYSQVQVSGTVVNDVGSPVSGAQVTLTMTPPGSSQTVTTNGSGQFAADFRITSYGTYVVQVTNVSGAGISYDAAGNAASSVTVVVN